MDVFQFDATDIIFFYYSWFIFTYLCMMKLKINLAAESAYYLYFKIIILKKSFC
jgi:hypothetical protein